MGVVTVSQFEDTFVIHFQTDGHRINAYTLASTLVAVADAAKAANEALNRGYDIEIVVEAVGLGSFRAQIRAIYASARNIFSEQNVKAIILSIIASYIYERVLSVDNRVQVHINTNEVVISQGNDRIVVPRNVYDATRVVERHPGFVSAISRTLEPASNDEHVSGIGFVPDIASPPPDVIISKEQLRKAASVNIEDEPASRVIIEQCELVIVKAILERSQRKWEFVWHGVRISAPIVDNQFYANFFAHTITIAPGDVLKARLSIKQTRDAATGIYTNLSYEVVEVLEHMPAPRQTVLGNDGNGS